MAECRDAAAAGELNELKRLHESGVEWDAWTCVAAAENGHLDCLRYAHEQGCDWDCLVCEHAIDGPSREKAVTWRVWNTLFQTVVR